MDEQGFDGRAIRLRVNVQDELPYIQNLRTYSDRSRYLKALLKTRTSMPGWVRFDADFHFGKTGAGRHRRSIASTLS